MKIAPAKLASMPDIIEWMSLPQPRKMLTRSGSSAGIRLRAVVRVLNQQIFTTGGESALACGGDFAGHLAAERLVIRLAQLGFVPMGDAARTFNVGGKKNSVQHCASSFHAMESAISIIWVKAVWRACASSDSPVPR